MKHVVMGTAGHIDHGKTTLVQALTGIDTDRLKEEKTRGMTIELGFAPLPLPSGQILSVVDVPGHEKFVKTMVAGAAGIDFALLVIAADEGIMPQTEEHIAILHLLGIQRGLVALTKSDLISEEGIRQREQEIREYLKDHWLADLPIHPVSSRTGEGMPQLIQSIDEQASHALEKPFSSLFRMPIDRIFTMTGHGTVVTGTISGGTIAKGDEVEILPEGLLAKVRGIQVHNKPVDQAFPGDRCALNLSGIEKSQIPRGSVVTRPATLSPVRILDVLLQGIPGKEPLQHHQRVHVHTGTKEALARVHLIGLEELPPGVTGYAQLRLEEPVVALRGDTFILRKYSPVYTIGGGRVLFHETRKKKKRLEEEYQFFQQASQTDSREFIGTLIDQTNGLVSPKELAYSAMEEPEQIRIHLKNLLETGRFGYIEDVDKFFSIHFYERVFSDMKAEFDRLPKVHPYRFQISREEIKNKVFPSMTPKDFGALLQYMKREGRFLLTENSIRMPDDILIQHILTRKDVSGARAFTENQGFSSFTLRQLTEELAIDARKGEEILRFLQDIHMLKRLGEDLYLGSTALLAARHLLKKILEERGILTVGDFRDILPAGRKAAIQLLEYFDSIGVTERDGNDRKPGIHFKDHE